jgi:hypothetical protein
MHLRSINRIIIIQLKINSQLENVSRVPILSLNSFLWPNHLIAVLFAQHTFYDITLNDAHEKTLLFWNPNSNFCFGFVFKSCVQKSLLIIIRFTTDSKSSQHICYFPSLIIHAYHEYVSRA